MRKQKTREERREAGSDVIKHKNYSMYMYGLAVIEASHESSLPCLQMYYTHSYLLDLQKLPWPHILTPSEINTFIQYLDHRGTQGQRKDAFQ